MNDGATAVLLMSANGANGRLTPLGTWLTYGESAAEHPTWPPSPRSRSRPALCQTGGAVDAGRLTWWRSTSLCAGGDHGALGCSGDSRAGQRQWRCHRHRPSIGASAPAILMTLLYELRPAGGGLWAAGICSGIAQGRGHTRPCRLTPLAARWPAASRPSSKTPSRHSVGDGAGRVRSPKRIVEAAGEAGLAGILTPEAYGGAGGSHADFIEFIERVAHADASCAVILDVHLSVGTEPLLILATMTRSRGTCAGWHAANGWRRSALTEAAGGSDAVALQTRAVRDGDTYVLDGAKAFITGAATPDLYIVMARTGEGAHGVSAFLVEAAWPGVSTGTPLAKMGLHGSWTGELVLDGVRVPAVNRLSGEGVWIHCRDVRAGQWRGRYPLAQAVRHRAGSARCGTRCVAAAPRRGDWTSSGCDCGHGGSHCGVPAADSSSLRRW